MISGDCGVFFVNGHTDGRTDPLIEMRGRIKKKALYAFYI